jgi:hypothetical protein
MNGFEAPKVSSAAWSSLYDHIIDQYDNRKLLQRAIELLHCSITFSEATEIADSSDRRILLGTVAGSLFLSSDRRKE